MGELGVRNRRQLSHAPANRSENRRSTRMRLRTAARTGGALVAARGGEQISPHTADASASWASALPHRAGGSRLTQPSRTIVQHGPSTSWPHECPGPRSSKCRRSLHSGMSIILNLLILCAFARWHATCFAGQVGHCRCMSGRPRIRAARRGIGGSGHARQPEIWLRGLHGDVPKPVRPGPRRHSVRETDRWRRVLGRRSDPNRHGAVKEGCRDNCRVGRN
jgi:hypothetical protein